MFNYKNVYIEEWFSIVGPKAKETNLKKYNLSINDYYFNDPFKKNNSFEEFF